MEDYKVRVIEEKKELDEKIVKLAAFIFSSNSAQRGAEEIHLLNGQLHCMIDYSMTLRERISRF